MCRLYLYSKISTDPGLLKIRHSHRFVAVVIQILIPFINAMLCDSVAVTVVAVVRTRPRAMPLAMINKRKSTHGFPFLSYEYGALLGGPSGAAGAPL